MSKVIYRSLPKKEIGGWQKEKEKEWEKNADFWVKIIRKNLDPYRLKVTNKAILEILKDKKNLKILDAGCGEGYLSRLLAKMGHQIWAIDFCPNLIKAAEKLEEKELLGIKYLLEDFQKTNFPSSFFDVIISHQTINEIKKPERAFKEFYRILKKRGKIILLFLHPCFEIKPEKLKNTSFAMVYFQKIKIERGYYLVSGIKSPLPYFYLHLPLSEWIELLSKSGFLIEKIKEPHPPLNLVKKDKWWRKNFKKPLFILIDAIKK